MKTHSDFASSYGSTFAAVWRTCGFLALMAALVPALIYCRLAKPHLKQKVLLHFYRLLIGLLGFRLRVLGTPAQTAPVLFVANHTSYLDVPVLGALVPAAFVAKADVAAWPVIGALAKMQGTVFIERRSSHIDTQRNHLREKLAAGQSLLLFPEGTSSDGLTVLPFKSSLFSVVEEAMEDIELTVQPISLTCTELDGLPIMRDWRPFYAWFGDMTFMGHLWNVFKLGHFTIDVIFHAPVSPKSFAGRKPLAAYCHEQVARGIEECLTGRRYLVKKTRQLKSPVPEKLIEAGN